MNLKLNIFFILVLTLLLLFIHIVEAQITIDCSSNSCSFTIEARYSTQAERCNIRILRGSVERCSVSIEFFGINETYTLCSPIFVIEKQGELVVLSRMYSGSQIVSLNYVLCENLFCDYMIHCPYGCSIHGSIRTNGSACPFDFGSGEGGGDQGSGSGCNCDWWNIPCHLMCIFNWLVNAILSLLQSFFNWIAEQIMNALPQPIRDFFHFMGQLFAFLGQLIAQMISYIPYFLFAIGLIFSFGFIYYIVEYGVVGVGMYFEMIYDLFRKFIELIMKVIDTITPF